MPAFIKVFVGCVWIEFGVDVGVVRWLGTTDKTCGENMHKVRDSDVHWEGSSLICLTLLIVARVCITFCSDSNTQRQKLG